MNLLFLFFDALFKLLRSGKKNFTNVPNPMNFYGDIFLPVSFLHHVLRKKGIKNDDPSKFILLRVDFDPLNETCQIISLVITW